MGGRVRMIDVGGKPDSQREAVARGTIRMQASTFKLLREANAGPAASVPPTPAFRGQG
jgi:molybdenum cofactor biosynthesis enzyme